MTPAVLPPLDEVLAAASVVCVPMRVRFRGVNAREAVVLRGPVGDGEFAPFVEYPDGEASRWLAAAVEAAWGTPHPWPAPRRPSVAVNATVPAVAASEVAGVLARFPGCTTAKVKVAETGQALDDDVARVTEVRRVLGPAGRVRVDANGAWTVDDAVRALGRLAPVGLEYAEQPCRDLAELRELRVRLASGAVDVPIAADESVRKAEDPARLALAGAADLVVLKVAPLGGVAAAADVAQALAAEHGMGVVVSSALDTSVGLAAGVALAAALPELPYACGLGTAALLAADVVDEPLLPVDGALPVPDAPPRADPERLATLAAPAPREDWWRGRLARCHRLLLQASAGVA